MDVAAQTPRRPAGAPGHDIASTLAYFIVVLTVALLFAHQRMAFLLDEDPFITLVTLLSLSVSFFELAHVFQKEGMRRQRRARDLRLRVMAKARVPSIIHRQA